MKKLTSDLIDFSLDWAVCKAGGGANDIRNWISGYWDYGMYHYSDNWPKGGPIIELEKMEFVQMHNPDYVNARCLYGPWVGGPTHLIAGMRCYVANKLGNEVDIPQELL